MPGVALQGQVLSYTDYHLLTQMRRGLGTAVTLCPFTEKMTQAILARQGVLRSDRAVSPEERMKYKREYSDAAVRLFANSSSAGSNKSSCEYASQ